MLTAVLADAGHPVVAGLLGLGAAGLATAVVVMAWSVNVHQIRLAEHLARRQFLRDPRGRPARARGERERARAGGRGRARRERGRRGRGS